MKHLTLALVFLLGACGCTQHIYPYSYEKGAELCAKHGGLKYIEFYATELSTAMAVCKEPGVAVLYSFSTRGAE